MAQGGGSSPICPSRRGMCKGPYLVPKLLMASTAGPGAYTPPSGAYTPPSGTRISSPSMAARYSSAMYHLYMFTRGERGSKV